MRGKHFLIVFSGVFLLIFSLLLLVAILFSEEEDGGHDLSYGGANVSAEVLAHKPMLEQYAREYGIEVTSMCCLQLYRWNPAVH